MREGYIWLSNALPPGFCKIGVRRAILLNCLPEEFDSAHFRIVDYSDEKLVLRQIFDEGPGKPFTISIQQCRFDLTWEYKKKRDLPKNGVAIFKGRVSTKLRSLRVKIESGAHYFNDERVTVVRCKSQIVTTAARILNASDCLYISFKADVFLLRASEKFSAGIKIGSLDDENDYATDLSDPSDYLENVVEAWVLDYVHRRANLGIYDPQSPRRPRTPVSKFSIEFLELEPDMTAIAAGPIVLQSSGGEVEKYLRISLKVNSRGHIAESPEVRAVYIEEINSETGACKETAALANE